MNTITSIEVMNDAMMLILWTIMFMMLFGFLAIKAFEFQLKNKRDEDETLQIETILMVFYNKDFAGKLYFTLLLGAGIISNMLFFWTKRNKELRKK